MSKKAQGMPINVIIIAAISLIVLVVLVAIFTGRIGLFGQKVSETGKDCSKYVMVEAGNTYGPGGVWKLTACTAEERQATVVTDANLHPTEVCCLPLTKQA